MIRSYDRGHETYLDGNVWRYLDNNNVVDNKRPCIRCGRAPTKEGHDACLGIIPNSKGACCGHGVLPPVGT